MGHLLGGWEAVPVTRVPGPPDLPAAAHWVSLPLFCLFQSLPFGLLGSTEVLASQDHRPLS